MEMARRGGPSFILVMLVRVSRGESVTLPAETCFPGGVAEDPVPGVVKNLPLLGGFVELDLGGSDDLEGPDLAKIDTIGVESRSGAVGSEVDYVGDLGGYHVDWFCSLGLWVELRFAGRR